MSSVRIDTDEPRNPRQRDTSRAIGGILVAVGRLRPEEANAIQTHATEHGIRFGDAGVSLNILSPDDVEFALARQHNYPIVARGQGGVSDEVVAAYDPQHPGVEAIRSLRSQILLNWLKSADRGILTVASPARREGKSWLAANLATAFAQVGLRTLLVDANLRHPQQHKFFNLNNSVGLSALLTGRAGQEIAHRIHADLRLFVMPAGLLPPNPQELITRPVFEVILNQCAKQFDLVIIDTPSIGEAADAQLIASQSGACLMVTRRNFTRQKELREAMHGLQQAGANVLGSMVNEYR